LELLKSLSISILIYTKKKYNNMAVPSKYSTAYTGGTSISGFNNIGNIAVDDTGSGDYSLAPFVGGILNTYDSSGYVIISDTTTSGVDTRSTGNHTGTASANTPTFWVSPTKDNSGFLYLVNRLPERKGLTPFTSGIVAKIWLNANGYWTSYVGFSSSITIATSSDGGLIGFNVGGQAVGLQILANPAIGTTYPIGSTIIFQNGEVRTINDIGDYVSVIDIGYDSPISTNILFPIIIGI